MNEDESLKCLKLSKNRFSEEDFEGALKLAIKAQRMFDSSETREWLEKVKTQDTDSSTTSNIRKRHVKIEEKVKIEEFTSTTTTIQSEPAAAYTPEQLKEVKEFMKRNKDDYYSLLGVDKSASQDELKKAYKKLALKFHPDKNQAPSADEAFKMISVAFSVLGDEEKRRNFDRFGVSSTNGSGPGGSTAGPFASPFASPFAAHFASPGFNFHESGEISPEELFNLFFNAAFSQNHPHAHPQQQSNPFGAGQFFFSSNFHTGHQQRQRQTRRQTTAETDNEDLLKKFIQFIPLIIIFFLSIISSWIFPSESSSSSSSYNNLNYGNEFSLNPSDKHRFQRITRLKNVPYYVTSNFQKHFSNIKDNTKLSRELARELTTFENLVETSFIKELKKSCDFEERQLAKLLKKAKKDQIEEIKINFKLNSCEKLKIYE